VVSVHERGPVDIVRWLEHGLIAALDTLGFPAIRRDTPAGETSLVGVWTPDRRKLASIGMRIRHGVTSHGFALNVDPDMSIFERFTVCGLHDVTMTSLSRLAAESSVETPSDAAVSARPWAVHRRPDSYGRGWFGWPERSGPALRRGDRC